MKEIHMQVQEAQSPKQDGPQNRTTLRHIIIKMPKVKDEERILKAAREKKRVNLQRNFHKTIS